MASMGWEKVGKRWRVFWHVTLPDGSVDKGSKSFKDKKVAQSFKKHCEKREQVLKRTEVVEPVLLDGIIKGTRYRFWDTILCFGFGVYVFRGRRGF